MHRSAPVVLECVMQCTQRACFVEPREIDLLCKICD